MRQDRAVPRDKRDHAERGESPGREHAGAKPPRPHADKNAAEHAADCLDAAQETDDRVSGLERVEHEEDEQNEEYLSRVG